MIRNLKALGLALVAALALGATAASSASAVDVATVDGADKATVTGLSHDNVFTITKAGGGTAAQFKCTTSSFTSTVEDGVAGATITADYKGIENETPHTNPKCTATVGQVTVDMNECDYDIGGNTSNAHGVDDYIPVWITCPKDKEIVITSGLCETTVPAQTPTEGGIRFTNENTNGTWDVLAHIKITGITTTAKHSFGCTLAGVPTHGQTGDYEGTVTLKGYEDTGTHTHNNNLLGITFS